MPNILFIEPSKSPFPGGSFQSALLLIRGLVENNYTVYVQFYRSNNLMNSFSKAGAKVLPPIYSSDEIKLYKSNKSQPQASRARQAVRKLLQTIPHYHNIRKFFLSDLKQIRWILSVIKKHRIELIHLNGGIIPNRDGIIAARLVGISCVVHERKIREYDSLDIYLSRYPQLIFAISDAVYRNCKQHLSNRPMLKRVYNPLIAEPTDPIKVSHIRKQYDDAPILSMVGNIEDWKGQLTFVKAMHIVRKNYNKKIKALLIGGIMDHNYFEALEEYINDNQLNDVVKYIGYVTDVENFMMASDVIIHASDKPEPFGRVITEAMSLGKIVVASGEGGPLEIIKNGKNGLLFNPRNAEDLASQILKVLNGKFQLDKNDLAEQIINKFSVKKHIDQIVEGYAALGW